MHTASLTNLICGNAKQPIPEVGMGATILGWTDRHPATVIAVSDKSVTVRGDDAVRTDDNGCSESQTWEFSPNPNGPEYTFTLRKNGKWVEKGYGIKDGNRLALGYRDRYYDFSF